MIVSSEPVELNPGEDGARNADEDEENLTTLRIVTVPGTKIMMCFFAVGTLSDCDSAVPAC